MIDDRDPCPCGGATYGSCCAPFHRGRASPATAELLMRSRYSAFALGDAAYLRTTWHPSTRPSPLDLDPRIEWRRLVVMDSVGGGADDDTGEVEFRAYWRAVPVPGRARDGGVLHERSRFRRDRGSWLYLEGTSLS